MKRSIWRVILTVFFLLAFVPVQAQTYDELWAQVESAQKKGQIATVRQCLYAVSRKAKEEKNFPHQLRAVLLDMAYLKETCPQSICKSMSHMQKWMESCREPVDKRILQFVLGNMYMVQAEHMPDSADMLAEALPYGGSAWTKSVFLEQAKVYFSAALSDLDLLAHVDARAYRPMVVVGEDSRYFGHDLLSVMAYKLFAWQHHLSKDYVDDLYCRLIGYYREAGRFDAVVLLAFESMCYDLIHSRFNEEACNRFVRQVQHLVEAYADVPAIARVYDMLPLYSWEAENTYHWMKEALRKHAGYKRSDVFRNVMDQLTCPLLDVYMQDVQASDEPATYEVNYRNINALQVEVWDIPGGRLVLCDTLALRPCTRPWMYGDTIVALPSLQPGLYGMRFVYENQITETQFFYNLLDIFAKTFSDGQLQVFVMERDGKHPLANARVECYDTTEAYWVDDGNFIHYQYEDLPCHHFETGPGGTVVFRPQCLGKRVGLRAWKEGYGPTDTLEISTVTKSVSELGKQDGRQSGDSMVYASLIADPKVGRIYTSEKRLRFSFDVRPCIVPAWGLTSWDAVISQRITRLQARKDTTVPRSEFIYVRDTGENPYEWRSRLKKQCTK